VSGPPEKETGRAPGSARPKAPALKRTLPRSPVQSQLSLFVWIVESYPVWFSRPDHSRMLWGMFGRIIGKECRE
jgi:hypothetical protein